ncbi:hypothetical protein ACFLX4_02560 [Chloroflexota bacterium]
MSIGKTRGISLLASPAYEGEMKRYITFIIALLVIGVILCFTVNDLENQNHQLEQDLWASRVIADTWYQQSETYGDKIEQLEAEIMILGMVPEPEVVEVEKPVELRLFKNLMELDSFRKKYNKADFTESVKDVDRDMFGEWCVGDALGLQILALREGYLLSTDIVGGESGNSHVVSQAILPTLTQYGIEYIAVNFEPTRGDYKLIGVVGEPE